MADIFDLFGDPVPPNHGGRGRPQHIPTQQNRNRVSLLTALGWNDARIAGVLRITEPTLRKHYFSELKVRLVARDRLEIKIAEQLWDGVLAGKGGAIRAFREFLDRNDLMTFGQKGGGQLRPVEDKPKPAEKLGKKAAAAAAAHSPDAGTPMGELMMRRQQSTAH